MIVLITLLIAVTIAVISLRKNIEKIKSAADKDGVPWIAKWEFWKCFILPFFLVVFSLVNPFKIERVDAGHVGIKVNLTGDNRGVSKFEYRTGWVMYNTWFSKLYEFPTYQQHIDYEEQVVITRGGFSATIKPSFNYSLKPGEVGDMFQNLRLSVKQLEQGWLHTAIVSTVNDVANKWTVDSIFNHREQFESDIIAETNRRTAKWFVVSQLRTNITPPPQLADAIIQKTKAIQDVQVAENQKLVAEAVMQRKIAEAKGDSAKAVIAATAEAQSMRELAAGEADAIKLRQLQLTPQYIEYYKLNKWNGVLPTVTAGGSGVLVDIRKN